jgi:excinuclease ABC subunit A
MTSRPTGLHFHDIKKLLEVLHEFVDADNTVVVIEHKDHRLAHRSRSRRRRRRRPIVAEGPPEDVAKVKESYTGQYLKELLRRRAAGGTRGGGVGSQIRA